MAGMETSKDYIAGLAAGVSTVLIGHPFDTVKVRGGFSVCRGVVARVCMCICMFCTLLAHW